MSRFSNISLGYDVKSNQKMIKLTPGPGQYETVPADDNAVIKKTFNHALKHGGIRVDAMTPKEVLMVKTFGGMDASHLDTNGQVKSTVR